jgi:DNA adenine methylase
MKKTAKKKTVERCSPPFQWVGSKYEQADWIACHFPRHITYVEGFAGAAGVLLWKEPSPVEVYNDLDNGLVNFFTVCRDRPEELARGLLFSPYSRSEWEVSVTGHDKEGLDPLERARRFAVVARQSMGGIWGKAWSSVIAHSRRGMASGNSRWLNLPEDVLAVAARLARVQIENLPALDCIRRYDREATLFYLDPPYVGTERSPKMYQHEMDLAQHTALLDALGGVTGLVVLSGYPNALYNDRLASWRRVERSVTCRSNVRTDGQLASRPKRVEVLWMNFTEHGKRMKVKT